VAENWRNPMIVTQSEIDYTRHRYDDLLAKAAEARFIAAATEKTHSTPPPAPDRFRAVLRQVVASLVMLASIG
jgi:hypothetical protein